MRKTAVTLLLAALGLLVFLGCDEENTLVPYFTRLEQSQTCGVVPMTVQFIARASGGNPTDDLTGANAFLSIDWNFGDGGSGNGSIVYHTFRTAGTYPVIVSVRDKDGEGETDTLYVHARADSLRIAASPRGGTPGGEPDTTVAAGQPVQFNIFAEMCGFDKDTGDYAANFKFRWDVGNVAGTVYHGRSPRHTYTIADRGLRQAIVTVEADQVGISRRDTVSVLVQ